MKLVIECDDIDEWNDKYNTNINQDAYIFDINSMYKIPNSDVKNLWNYGIDNILPINYISETETNLYFECLDHIEKYAYFINENDLYN